MPRAALFTFFYLAIFLQAGAYGLTFLLPRLFAEFGADEKTVGVMLSVTAISTILTVGFAGHLSDLLGRVRLLGLACLSISIALVGYGIAHQVGLVLVLASLAMGAGWGLTYALPPIVLTGLVTAQDRVRFFAILSVAMMAGFGLSPVMASGLQTVGVSIQQAFLLMAVLCGIAAVIFFALVGAVRAQSDSAGTAPKASLSRTALSGVMRSPARLPVIMVAIGASVFAGMSNFQTVFADARGLDYAQYFLVYTVTVMIFRVVLAKFTGGPNPYLTISALQYVMAGAVLLFLFSGSNPVLYLVVATLFGIGYGVSYPILAAMAANDAEDALVPQTLQIFALSYFVGIFGFPLVAGWMIVELGSGALLTTLVVLAGVEATMALIRALQR